MTGTSDPPGDRSAGAARGARRYGRPQRTGLVLGPVLLAAVLLAPLPAGLTGPGLRVAAVALLMAVWWITEAIPIPATALLPLALFPLVGAGTIRETAAPYAHPLIFLFLGGFMMALAMQRWGLHRRIALGIISRAGTAPASLVGGFMASAALLSMWVSNTATAMMMLPIGLSVIELSRDLEGGGDAGDPFAVALLLGIAYACSIGGLGTLIGTPPNAFMAGFLSETRGIEIGFAQWMLVGVPLVLVALPLAYGLLTRVVFRVPSGSIRGGREVLSREIEALGPMTRPERMVAIVFGVTASAWILRPVIERWIPGLSDAGIAVAAAIALFLLPVRPRSGEFVLSWEWARRAPWGVLLLFGGGLSLAAAIERTGLAAWIAEGLLGLAELPFGMVLVAATALVILLTELTSNTATAATFLPILASVGEGIAGDPLALVVPATLAASCAFMLPVATPPNAIVYGSNRLTIPQMARAGLLLNVLLLALISVVSLTLVPLLLGPG